MADPRSEAVKKIRDLEREIRAQKRILLEPRDEGSGPSPGIRALVVNAGRYVVGLPVESILEVVPMVLVSPLPRAPAAVRGTISYRGKLVPVLDLVYSFSGISGPLSPDQFLVLLEGIEDEFALAIDGVEEVQRFATEDLEHAPVITDLPGFVTCLFKTANRSVIMLDSSGLLAAGELDLLRQLLLKIASQEANPSC